MNSKKLFLKSMLLFCLLITTFNPTVDAATLQQEQLVQNLYKLAAEGKTLGCEFSLGTEFDTRGLWQIPSEPVKPGLWLLRGFIYEVDLSQKLVLIGNNWSLNFPKLTESDVESILGEPDELTADSGSKYCSIYKINYNFLVFTFDTNGKIAYTYVTSKAKLL